MARTDILDNPSYLHIAFCVLAAGNNKMYPTVDDISNCIGAQRDNTVKKLANTTKGKKESRYALFLKQKLPKEMRSRPGRAHEYYIVNLPIWAELFYQEMIDQPFYNNLEHHPELKLKSKYNEYLRDSRKDAAELAKLMQTIMLEMQTLDYNQYADDLAVKKVMYNDTSIRTFFKIIRSIIIQSRDTQSDKSYWEACLLASTIEDNFFQVFVDAGSDIINRLHKRGKHDQN